MESNESVLVRRAFEGWMEGSSHVSELFAPRMTWEIVGRSAASATCQGADEFIAKVLEPFGRRFVSSDPFRPVRIRGIYSDGPTVIVVWDGAGTTVAGTTYKNTYAWVLTFDQGMIIEGLAFYDSIAFNELWEVAPHGDRSEG